MALVSLSKLKKDLAKLYSNLEVMEEKKILCVNEQFYCEDNNITHLARYTKAIELDFEISYKIEEYLRLIKNKIAQIKRREKQLILN